MLAAPPCREGSREGRPPLPGRELSQERTWRRADAGPASGGDDAAPRERPRLNLAPRSAAPAGGAAPGAHGASKASVFGAARPREEVLREQGRDAVKEDLKYEHEAVDRCVRGMGGAPTWGSRDELFARAGVGKHGAEWADGRVEWGGSLGALAGRGVRASGQAGHLPQG